MKAYSYISYPCARMNPKFDWADTMPESLLFMFGNCKSFRLIAK